MLYQLQVARGRAAAGGRAWLAPACYLVFDAVLQIGWDPCQPVVPVQSGAFAAHLRPHLCAAGKGSASIAPRTRRRMSSAATRAPRTVRSLPRARRRRSLHAVPCHASAGQVNRKGPCILLMRTGTLIYDLDRQNATRFSEWDVYQIAVKPLSNHLPILSIFCTSQTT